MSRERWTPQWRERGGGYSLGGQNNDFYSLTGKHKYVHTLGTALKLLHTLRRNAFKNNKSISEQSAAPCPEHKFLGAVKGAILSRNPHVLP